MNHFIKEIMCGKCFFNCDMLHAQLFTLEITVVVIKASVEVNCLSQLSQIVRSLTLSHDSR